LLLLENQSKTMLLLKETIKTNAAAELPGRTA
jgi:hypothetical protein